MLWNMTAAAGAFLAPGALNRGVTMSWFDSKAERQKWANILSVSESMGRTADEIALEHRSKLSPEEAAVFDNVSQGILLRRLVHVNDHPTNG